MEGVVSLLDAAHVRAVEALWAEIEATYGVRGVSATPVPHFSYQVAERYDLPALAVPLRRLARGLRPFRVRTSGLGIFSGPRPVLYVPVVRDEALTRLHAALWEAIGGAGSDLLVHYEPERWLPHITLAHGDLDPAGLAALVGHLAERDFGWEIVIDNLALLDQAVGPRAVRLRVDLGATAGGAKPARQSGK